MSTLQGAAAGLIASVVLTYWMNVGAIITKPPPTRLPLRTAQCPGANVTDWQTTTEAFSHVNTTTEAVPREYVYI